MNYIVRRKQGFTAYKFLKVEKVDEVIKFSWIDNQDESTKYNTELKARDDLKLSGFNVLSGVEIISV